MRIAQCNHLKVEVLLFEKKQYIRRRPYGPLTGAHLHKDPKTDCIVAMTVNDIHEWGIIRSHDLACYLSLADDKCHSGIQ